MTSLLLFVLSFFVCGQGWVGRVGCLGILQSYLGERPQVTDTGLDEFGPIDIVNTHILHTLRRRLPSRLGPDLPSIHFCYTPFIVFPRRPTPTSLLPPPPPLPVLRRLLIAVASGVTVAM